MAKLSFRTVLQKHLDFLRELRNNIKSHDVDSKIYLDSCILTLQKELDGKPMRQTTMYYDPKTYKFLIDCGVDQTQALMLSYLINASEPLIVLDLYNASGLDRGKIYRALDNLVEDKAILKIPGGITSFVVKDKDNPYKFLAEQKRSELEHLERITLQHLNTNSIEK